METVKINEAIFNATNKFRMQYGLSLFHQDGQLTQGALLHSGNMVQHNFFSHTDNINTRFRDAMKRVQYYGGNFQLVGENIAFMPLIKDKVIRISFFPFGIFNPIPQYPLLNAVEFAKVTVDSWMNSPGHRNNILNKDFTYLGIGTVLTHKIQSGIKVPYGMVTQDFGGYVGQKNSLFPVFVGNKKQQDSIYQYR